MKHCVNVGHCSNNIFKLKKLESLHTILNWGGRKLEGKNSICGLPIMENKDSALQEEQNIVQEISVSKIHSVSQVRERPLQARELRNRER